MNYVLYVEEKARWSCPKIHKAYIFWSWSKRHFSIPNWRTRDQ